jgi:beta-galactosidase/beta-glucuronidase
MKCYQPDYPRPQFTRDKESWESLNGSWNFSFDDKNEGLTEKWFYSFPESRNIKVPFNYETPASGMGDSARHDVVWYKHNLSIDAERLNKKIILHFEGSDYNTQVWINGNLVGNHDGAYARFSFDISQLVKSGDNTITVRVEDSFDISQPRGKQRWQNENFGCWYIQTTGIWKTVWLEYVNSDHIKSVKMTPVLFEGKLEIEAELNIEAEFCSALNGLEFEASVSFKETPVTKTKASVQGKRVKFAVDIFSTAITEWGVHTWSPESPNLYDISFSLKNDGKVLDEVFSYFGMREIRIDGPNILLNGRPIYQRLILDQGYWKDSHLTPPNEEALVADIDNVMAAGYNGVRKHQKIEDERFLYWADVKGLLVWSEMAAAYEFNDDAVTMFTHEWMEIVQQNYNHPAIITWTPFNESWGVPTIKTNKQQQHFTESIYYLTKSYDKYRPVICNDGWEHTISDIITLHDYVEDGEEFTKRYAEHLEEILNGSLYHDTKRSAFAEGYSYAGQPIIISEFGGIAFNNTGDGWGYGNKVGSKEDYIKRFDSITTAIKKLEIVCGYCYTQVTDVQQEINGIMDIERNFKVEPEILKEINERKLNSLLKN